MITANKYEKILNLIQDLSIDNNTKKLLLKEFSYLQKTVEKQDFKITRLKEDKKITEYFLNANIQDLEVSNKLLVSYKEKELLQKENQLLFKESQLRQIIDALPSGIAYIGKDFKYKLFNDLYNQWFGCPEKTIIGRHVCWCDRKLEFNKLIIPILKETFQGSLKEFIISIVDFNENNVILKVYTVPALDNNGNNIGAYMYAQDITAIKNKENELKESEERIRDVFDNVYDAIIELDSEGYITNFNDAARKFFDVDNPLGLHVPSIVHPDDIERSKFFFEKLKNEGFYENYQGRILKEDGTIIYIEVNSVGKFDKNGNLIGSRDIVRNLTETVKIQKILEDKNVELERYIESNMQLENFAYLASHDLKAPLDNVRNFSNLLNESALERLNTEEKIFLQFILQGVNNMQKTIKSLLSFSQVSNKKLELQKVCIFDTLNELKTDLSVTINENKAEIILPDTPKKLFISVDKILFRQLMQNLILNAMKFTPKGENPIIFINCTSNQQGGWLISVKDNGIGIADEFKEKIFLLFKRLHLKKDYDGLGIGLSICKKIVELHNGRIWVESEEGKGSTFYFTINN